RAAGLAVVVALGEERRDPLPLGVSKIKAVHGGPPSGNRPPREMVSTFIVRRTPIVRNDLERVARGLETYTIALLCGEEDPLDCHRGLMIAPALVEAGVTPAHLRRGGRVETQLAFEERLQQAAGVGGLFGLGEAYRVLNRKVAHRLESGGD